MARHHVDEPVVDEPPAGRRLEVLGDAVVPAESLVLGESGVGDLADDVAAERPVVTVEHEDVLGRQRLDETFDVGDGTERSRELVERHHRATRSPHRRILEHELLVRCQAVDPGSDQAAERVGDVTGVSTALAIAQQRGQLLEVERVAATSIEEHRADVLGDVGVEEGVEQLRGGAAFERVEVHDDGVLTTGPRRPPVEQGAARRRHEHERLTCEAFAHVVDEVEHLLVGPMQVGQADDDGPHLHPGFDERVQR